jgi:hypothetical protein
MQKNKRGSGGGARALRRWVALGGCVATLWLSACQAPGGAVSVFRGGSRSLIDGAAGGSTLAVEPERGQAEPSSLPGAVVPEVRDLVTSRDAARPTHRVPARTSDVSGTVSKPYVSLHAPFATSGPDVEVSIGLGGHFGGDITIAPDREFTAEADGGFLSKITVDFFPHENFGFGVFLNNGTVSNLDTDAAFGTTDGHFTTFGVEAKGRLAVELDHATDLLITPGLGLGVRGLFFDQGSIAGPTIEDSVGLAVNFGVDARLRFNDRYDVFIEPGFLTQPAGGNDTADVTFGPIGYLLVGGGVVF